MAAKGTRQYFMASESISCEFRERRKVWARELKKLRAWARKEFGASEVYTVSNTGVMRVAGFAFKDITTADPTLFCRMGRNSPADGRKFRAVKATAEHRKRVDSLTCTVLRDLQDRLKMPFLQGNSWCTPGFTFHPKTGVMYISARGAKPPTPDFVRISDIEYEQAVGG